MEEFDMFGEDIHDNEDLMEEVYGDMGKDFFDLNKYGDKDVLKIVRDRNIEDSIENKKIIDAINKGEKKFLNEYLKIQKFILPDFIYNQIIDEINSKNSHIFSQIRNEILIKDAIDQKFDMPTSNVSRSFLSLCYKRDIPCSILSMISNQAAATVRTLREQFKCIFAKNVSSDYWVVKKGKYCYRRINGIDKSKDKIDNRYIQVNKKVMNKFLKDKVCACLGNKKKLQMDHKIPVSVCESQGRMPAILTEDKIRNGEWEKDFQILSKEVNYRKSGACNVCFNKGEEIPVDPVFKKLQKIGMIKKMYDGKCEGCVWHDLKKWTDR